MNELLPVLLLGVVAVAFAAGSIGVSNLVGPRRPNPTKLGAYESGNEPLADVPGTRFSVKFYMVAMLFLIFDVEAVFVYPWAVVLRELGWAGLWQMVVFLGILGVAFVYEIGRGGVFPVSGLLACAVVRDWDNRGASSATVEPLPPIERMARPEGRVRSGGIVV